MYSWSNKRRNDKGRKSDLRKVEISMENLPEKILYMTTQLSFGGAEVQVVALANRFKARGHEVFVVSMREPAAFREELSRAGVPLFSLRMPRGIPSPIGLYRLLIILRQVRPGIMHCHLFHANLLGRLARLLTTVPVVISTAHSIAINRRWWKMAYRLTDGLSDLTTNVSVASTTRYLQQRVACEGKLIYVPNGIDTERFHPNRFQRDQVRRELGVDKSFAWIAVGRFEQPKDYPNLLRAFALLKKKTTEIVLLLVGDGQLRSEMGHLVRVLNIEESVRFLGLRKDVPGLLQASDGYVMSSKWEGMPIVLLEAAASGLPIVATLVGGNQEVVSPGAGILVPPGEPEQLADAMNRIMLLSEDERLRMGAAARAHVDKSFKLESVVDRWEEIYRDLLVRV